MTKTMLGSNSYLCPASDLKQGMYIVNPANGVRDFEKIIAILPNQLLGWLAVYTKEDGRLDAGTQNLLDGNKFIEVLNAKP